MVVLCNIQPKPTYPLTAVKQSSAQQILSSLTKSIQSPSSQAWPYQAHPRHAQSNPNQLLNISQLNQDNRVPSTCQPKYSPAQLNVTLRQVGGSVCLIFLSPYKLCQFSYRSADIICRVQGLNRTGVSESLRFTLTY